MVYDFPIKKSGQKLKTEKKVLTKIISETKGSSQIFKKEKKFS